ncbi:uncharacterized protein ATNIH1004_003919 [Aspergillus tanneri]|uniref:Uncharacterized protein n=1 Tax=Aspergillus tanneri TaxID=1220188 RepID=A0A5M9MQ61_9EURO|nr:uncharacterized protein ATNIH1004_003919 [Aspergillus tanneri]KAA8648036.1 hypothetical protein ATNIH1004_003919 [Aspergillus tanneri]
MRKKLLKKIISQEDGTAQKRLGQILEFLLSSARRTLVHLYKAGNAQYSHIDAGILLVALGFMGKRSFSFVSGTDSSPSEGVTKCVRYKSSPLAIPSNGL